MVASPLGERPGRVRAMSARLGATVPLAGLTLAEHQRAVAELFELGFVEFWAGEADGLDAVVPLAAIAAWHPAARVATSILPVFTRGPGVLAMTAASMAELAPGRFTLGLGASSPIVVQAWNALDYERPLARTRDTVRFLTAALPGARVRENYETFVVDGFRLGRVPAQPPPLMLAALRPRMIELAAAETAGVISTWVAPDHVAKVAGVLHAARPAGATPARLAVWVTIAPDHDAGQVRALAAPLIATYLNVPAYAAFHRWLGNEAPLAAMWRAWTAGDRRGALAAIDDALVEQFVIHGPAAHCRQRIDEYAAAGATEIAVTVLPGVDPMSALRAVAPQ